MRSRRSIEEALDDFFEKKGRRGRKERLFLCYKRSEIKREALYDRARERDEEKGKCMTSSFPQLPHPLAQVIELYGGCTPYRYATGLDEGMLRIMSTESPAALNAVLWWSKGSRTQVIAVLVELL